MIDSNDESPFQLTLPGFEGSVDALLRLVTQRKVSPRDLELSAMTHQFRAYMDDGVSPDLDVTGDFVAASARLLALKSGDLLIEPIEEEDLDSVNPLRGAERDLFQALSQHLLQREGIESFSAVVPAFSLEKRYEPRPVSMLGRAWLDMQGRVRTRVQSVTVPAFVRLEVALSGLIRRLRGGNNVSFRSLVRGAGKNDAVVHFLAVLELVRRRQARVEQVELFGDISIEAVEHGAESPARAG